MDTFGRRICAARKIKKLTLAEVGARVGLPESSVQRYEKGIYPNPTRSLILRFSQELGIPLNELMGWSDNPPDEDIHLLTRSFCGQPNDMSPRTRQILRFILEDGDGEDAE